MIAIVNMVACLLFRGGSPLIPKLFYTETTFFRAKLRNQIVLKNGKRQWTEISNSPISILTLDSASFCNMDILKIIISRSTHRDLHILLLWLLILGMLDCCGLLYFGCWVIVVRTGIIVLVQLMHPPLQFVDCGLQHHLLEGVWTIDLPYLK